MSKSTSRKKRRPKWILALPDREHAKTATWLKRLIMSTRENIKNRITIGLTIIGVFITGLLAPRTEAQKPEEKKPQTIPTIAFISSRYDPALKPSAWLLGAEIYLMNGDGTNARRITHNTTGEGFPALSPDGKRIVFESNRLRKESDPINWASLFVMNVDGSGEVSLVPGNSATWSRDSKSIAFHASASGKGNPITGLPGAASNDSDIFILNVDEFLSKKSPARNITNNPDAVDDDPDWSPDGEKIAFTSHAVSDDQTNPVTAEIYVIEANGKGKPRRLTNNSEEERAPDWSPDGKLIAYMCRKGEAADGRTIGTFEICVVNADGSGQKRITTNRVAELGPSWSPDGKQIIFHRAVGGVGQYQLFTINADGTGEKQLTFPPGFNGFPSWGRAAM
jgi:TolB protein